MIVFGNKKEGKIYINRPAIYGLIQNDEKNKIAVIQMKDNNYFLPGGGVEGNENHKECLIREVLEEIGMSIKVEQYIGCAKRYFYSNNNNQFILNIGYFYLCHIGEKIREPIEEDHYLEWLTPKQAVSKLYHEHQSWAVEKALQ